MRLACRRRCGFVPRSSRRLSMAPVPTSHDRRLREARPNSKMPMNIEGAVALVVGADRSVGYALCRGLAEAGMILVVGAIDDADVFVNEIRAAAGTASTVDVDPEDLASAETAARSVVDRHGRLDVLINGAAHPDVMTVAWDAIHPDDWDRCFRSTVRSVWHLSRAVSPYMKERGSGAIVNLGSASAWSGTTGS